MEPTGLKAISPELVLVDPELALVERARLVAEHGLELPVAPRAPRRPPARPDAPAVAPPQLVHPAQPPSWRRRVVANLLTLSLLANLILFLVVVAEAHETPTSLEQPAAGPGAVVGETAAGTTTAAPSRPKARSRARPRRSSPRKAVARRRQAAVAGSVGAVESQVLTLLVRSPKGRLPPQLIDSRTGLAKSNLQATCRREKRTGSFVCFVRPARHASGEGLYVRYRRLRNGHVTFTWYRYRPGSSR